MLSTTMRNLLLFLLCSHLCIAQAQPRTDSLLKRLIYRAASPALQHILQHPDSFRYQLIYTQIDRDADNTPHFKNHYLAVDADKYFNPASTVKMPVALLALEKLRELQIPGLNGDTPMFTDSAWSGQVTVHTDSSARNYLPSVHQYIKKIFLVSDNDAYNRLYEFVGQQTIHEKLWQKGYRRTRIVRRFMPLTEEENRHTNPIRFATGGKVIYSQPAAYDTLTFDFSKPHYIGNAYLDKNERLVLQPMDFTRHNNLPVEDLQQLLQSVLFPASVPAGQRFNLTAADYRFLYQYMSQYPSETSSPKYDTTEYFNSYTKFFLFKGAGHDIPPHMRVFNKTGWSYGFLTDAAYIVDFKRGIEFMLTGTLYVNRDGVLNDNKYEYEETGYPYFREIGDIIYRYEQQRKKAHQPDLNTFKIDYGK
ncbi:class A beta-lactamase-related serine hydrolase [Chitinophaga nivalis]|uniref:beta-lactamase n=1 Tax=Chitinophaga nivalis TaxID=2991709 RepID=A0ABT3IUK7_9BACT|nr:class A beta-lactamase-related serine hydrolase [Chitinophaga nivalis]MCW3462675.1 class A beta-lactamase-related serine hydrolase [Chitinophaga nivalis]MCW3487634.1 class A beta-lactamase-related serine hydrolase [Chitinophaga nivalis]